MMIISRRAASLSLAAFAAGCQTAATTTPGAATTATAAAGPVVPIVPIPAQREAREGTIDVAQGGKLRYWDTGGAGAAVIFLHPWTGSYESWPYQQPVFADAGYRAISYSRRYHYGSSGELATPQNSHIPDLLALMQALNVERAHLVGVAAGGVIGAEFSVAHPQRVASLVIGCSIISVTDPFMTESRNKLGFTGAPRMPPFMEISSSYRFANPEGFAKWAEVERRSHLVQSPPEQFNNTITLAAIAASARPIMLLAGDCDIYMPPALLEQVGTRLPNAEKPITIIDNAAHAPFWEQPAAFNAAVMAFIRRNA